MPARSLRNLLISNANKGGGIRQDLDTIEVYGPIVGEDEEAEWFGGVSLGQFRAALSAVAGETHLRINSPGGDVFAGRAMAQLIREHGYDVIAHVDGAAASAASLLVVAATKAVMAPGAMLMIHNAWTLTMGNAADHAATAELLAKVDGGLAATYAGRGHGDAAHYAALMSAETWFTPEEALAEGLVDEVVEDRPKASKSWDLSAYSAAPYRVAAEGPEIEPAPAPEPDPAEDAKLVADTEIEDRRRRLAARLLQDPAA
jgi:ATP-dependent Clp protease protease subunit